MLLQVQSLTSPHFLPPLIAFKTIAKPQFIHFNQTPPRKFSLNCSLSMVSDPTAVSTLVGVSNDKPFPAEMSRTIMELSSVGTLSVLTSNGWPLGVGVRFTVDNEGTPVLCLNQFCKELSVDKNSSLHVQLGQCGLRTPQCTIQGSLDKPKDLNILKRLHALWKKQFGEEVDENLIHVIAVERVLQMEDFQEVSEAKMIWVDRLGFDIRLCSTQNNIFDVRIPFPHEVTNEKGVKSSLNCMSQQAWEVEKNYQAPDFKVKQLKQIT